MTSVAKAAGLAIRTPQPADYARMAELAGQLGCPSERQDIEKRLAEMRRSPEYAVFVAEAQDGAVAGWVGVFLYRCVEADTRAEISGLVVDEKLRSSGIGQRLIERAEEWARERGCGAVGVRSNVIRERAHKFYDRLGYKYLKTQKTFRKDL